jgi:hypothetical protein
VPAENVWPARSASSFSDLALGGLHQRIGPVDVRLKNKKWSYWFEKAIQDAASQIVGRVRHTFDTDIDNQMNRGLPVKLQM